MGIHKNTRVKEVSKEGSFLHLLDKEIIHFDETKGFGFREVN